MPVNVRVQNTKLLPTFHLNTLTLALALALVPRPLAVNALIIVTTWCLIANLKPRNLGRKYSTRIFLFYHDIANFGDMNFQTFYASSKTNRKEKVLNLLRLTDDFGLNLATSCISA